MVFSVCVWRNGRAEWVCVRLVLVCIGALPLMKSGDCAFDDLNLPNLALSDKIREGMCDNKAVVIG